MTMAFTATTPEIIFLGVGSAKSVGRYANTAGSTGGDISHGLSVVKGVVLTPTSTAVTSQHVYNETLPLGSMTAVTIVTGANEGGSYEIYGEL